MKKEIYHLLHKNKFFISSIYLLIIFNVTAIVLESDSQIRQQYRTVFNWIEIISVSFFTLEYFMRLWVADIDEKVNNSRLKFAFSPLGLVDLLAIIPFYIPLFFIVDLRVLRVLRLLRLIVIFKLGRFSKSFKTIHRVLKKSKPDLAITFFVAFLLLILSSTLMYYVEHEAQPQKFGSIAHSLWWSVATLTTVGYGDVYPITGVGKMFSGIIALIGVGFVALPTAIISSAFVEELNEKKKKEKTPSLRVPKMWGEVCVGGVSIKIF